MTLHRSNPVLCAPFMRTLAIRSTLDGPQRKGDLRRSRAAAVNIVPNSTGAAKAIGLVIPELNGKADRFRTACSDPNWFHYYSYSSCRGKCDEDQVNAAMKAASNESFGYNEDEIVSSDIIGMRYGSLFDATQTMVLPLENGTTEVQVISWYDNENSYTSQMVSTIKHFGTLLYYRRLRVRPYMDRTFLM